MANFGISPRGIAALCASPKRRAAARCRARGFDNQRQSRWLKLLSLRALRRATWKTEAPMRRLRRTTICAKSKKPFISMGMEVAYSKEDILTIYFTALLGAVAGALKPRNRISANHRRVNPAESAMLAGL